MMIQDENRETTTMRDNLRQVFPMAELVVMNRLSSIVESVRTLTACCCCLNAMTSKTRKL